MGFTLNASLRVGLPGLIFPKFSKWRILGRFKGQIPGWFGAVMRFPVRGGTHRGAGYIFYDTVFVILLPH
jgi:hypothetical protein